MAQKNALFLVGVREFCHPSGWQSFLRDRSALCGNASNRKQGESHGRPIIFYYVNKKIDVTLMRSTNPLYVRVTFA